MFNWRDKRNLLTLSSVYEHSDEFKVNRKNKRNKGKVWKPQPVINYSASRTGVEKSYQIFSYHRINGKKK